MKTSDFDYKLPAELIAQTPIEPRDHSRLMVVDRETGETKHRRFFEVIDYIKPGDVLVFNESRVINARLYATKADTGGQVEILLLRRLGPHNWEALTRSNKRLSVGTILKINHGSETSGQQSSIAAEITDAKERGVKVINFSDERLLSGLGQVPLPPYIHTPLADPERYQTVYAHTAGSVAAPTAGLHFTTGLIQRIRKKGASCLFINLHVGLDTFRPVRGEDPTQHHISQEYGIVSPEVAAEISRAKTEGRRVIGIGTTTVRLLEAAAGAGPHRMEPFDGWVSLFILPGHRFGVVDAMVTNFHLPRSTLLMLVTAFGGQELIHKAYREAIANKYRFYSFGDAMLIL
ncbi:tRNA preQ1(34) S-adenosylmethionine ribosyltransferase-isomerase QueA [Chloroflexota bacterium]